MSPANPSIFLLGATGYVGGCFLNQLLSLEGEARPSKVTVLSRSEEKFDLINKLSTKETKVEGLKGTFEDHELLSRTVEDYDIVIEAGDSDNQELVNALLEGMKRRKEAGKEVTRFIHVSGTGTLADDARGEYKTETVSLRASATCHQTRQANRMVFLNSCWRGVVGPVGRQT
jgi:putative NADH-flavin reductase